MRLIDADKLIHALANEFIDGKKTLGQVIDEQQIVYDTEKVIEQIKALKEIGEACVDKQCGNCKYLEMCEGGRMNIILDKVIDIVKGGGTE